MLAGGAFEVLAPATAEHINEVCSTDWANLTHHPIASLACSYPLSGGFPLAWSLALVVGVGACEQVLGPVRVLTICVATHVAATLLSQGLLLLLVRSGERPVTDLADIDIGPSYVAVAGLAAACVLATPGRRFLAAALLLVLAPTLLRGLASGDTAAVGHVLAATLGAGLAALSRGHRRTPARVDGLLA